MAQPHSRLYSVLTLRRLPFIFSFPRIIKKIPNPIDLYRYRVFYRRLTEGESKFWVTAGGGVGIRTRGGLKKVKERENQIRVLKKHAEEGQVKDEARL